MALIAKVQVKRLIDEGKYDEAQAGGSGDADGARPGEGERSQEARPDGAPEPPAGYVARPGGLETGGRAPDSRQELESARRMVRAAQIMALVSIVVGGVVLSTAALVVALLGRRKASAAMSGQSAEPTASALKRSATVAAAMGLIALALNVAALIALYPMLVEIAQSGDYSTLWNPSEPSASSSSSFWG